MKEDYEEECKWANARNYTKCGILIEDDFPYEFIDHKQVKYISFARINKNELNETSRFDGLEEPREIYIADSENHCIRRIVVRQANVDTVAGICGKPGFKDGVFSTNQLNRPEMVALDAQGNMFIYDGGNDAIRMVTISGTMVTLIGGGCRQDKTMPTIDIPFDLTLRGMVCYKTWIKGVQQEDLNKIVDSSDGGGGNVEEAEEEEEEDKAAGQAMTKEEREQSLIKYGTLNVLEGICLEVHPVLCPYLKPHPLVRERDLPNTDRYK